MRLYFIRAFQSDDLYMYQFLDITISLQISSQEAITFANIVFQSMSGFWIALPGYMEHWNTFINSFVRSFVCLFVC